MEIKPLPTVAGTMEGGLRIGPSSFRSTQSSVCVYINIQLLREEKERTEERRGKDRDRGSKVGWTQQEISQAAWGGKGNKQRGG